MHRPISTIRRIGILYNGVGIADPEDGTRLACRLVERDDVPLAVGQAVEMLVLQYRDGPLFAARPLP